MDMKLELARSRLADSVSLEKLYGSNVMPAMKAEGPRSAPTKEPEEENKEEPELKCLAKPVEEYTQPFCEFLTENPTVFHAVDYFKRKLEANGFTEVCYINFMASVSSIIQIRET